MAGAEQKEKVGAEPGSGGGPWRAGGDSGKTDSGLTVERGRGLTDRPPPLRELHEEREWPGLPSALGRAPGGGDGDGGIRSDSSG